MSGGEGEGGREGGREGGNLCGPVCVTGGAAAAGIRQRNGYRTLRLGLSADERRARHSTSVKRAGNAPFVTY